MRKVLVYTGATLITLGALAILGTAGASDQNTITFEQSIVQVLISSGVIAVGGVAVKVAAELERIKNRKESRK